MNECSLKERIYLKGKEASIVGILLILAIIIFIVPIVIIFLLRFLFKSLNKIRKNASVHVKVDSCYGFESKLEY